MRISIVTISYNQSKYLEEAINSVVNQKYHDLEYIVVDALSTDGTDNILKTHRNQITRVIKESDKGPADGLNKGFRYATGDILGYLNADDIYLPNTLKEVAEIFSENPLVDVVCGGGFIIDDKGQRIRKIYSDPFSKKRYLYGGVTILQQSPFFRRRAFEAAGGFNAANTTSWDGELILSFARRNKMIKTVHRLWSGFRIHGESISGTGRVVNQYRKDLERFFTEEYGRPMNGFDRILSYYYRFEKWLLNPIALCNRIRGLITMEKGESDP
jgi:glycosyltransferase involved in cell wall biosynthesis